MRVLLFRLLLATVLGLLVLPGVAWSADKAKKHRDTWVMVTRPVLSCGSMKDSEQLKETLLDALVHPMPGGALPEGCSLLSVGDKYLLDGEQTEEETQIVVKMWAGVCPKGCLPTMTPIYAPPRRLVGRYLKPTKAPPGWE